MCCFGATSPVHQLLHVTCAHHYVLVKTKQSQAAYSKLPSPPSTTLPETRYSVCTEGCFSVQLHTRTVTTHTSSGTSPLFQSKMPWRCITSPSAEEDVPLSEEWAFPTAGCTAVQRSIAERDHKHMWQKPATEELNGNKSNGIRRTLPESTKPGMEYRQK